MNLPVLYQLSKHIPTRIFIDSITLLHVSAILCFSVVIERINNITTIRSRYDNRHVCDYSGS